jgi:saccharopine dehydrogenase-like NADP-dependent oxidoreductase
LNRIVLFGAGKSASVLIKYLLEHAEEDNYELVVADADAEQASRKTAGHPRSSVMALNIEDQASRKDLISSAHIVVSMMPPALHILIAADCLELNKHLLTASYADDAMRALHHQAQEKNLLFLCEMGLDPGIDHMSAMQIIHRIKSMDGQILSFKSHCGGLVAPESDNNPWRYKVSWNPRNIVLAGKAGAVYRQNDLVVMESYKDLFDAARLVDTQDPNVGILSYYPNRNSLSYVEQYHLEETSTFIRTTLRYPDFMYGWKNLIELKLTEETVEYNTDGMSLKEFFKEHMEKNGFTTWLQQKLADNFNHTKSLLENLMKLIETEEAVKAEGEEIPDNFMLVDERGNLRDIELDEIKQNAAATMALQVHEAGLTLKQLVFLGMDDDQTVINKGMCSAADVLQFCLEQKLALSPEDRDMVVMLHEFDYSIEGTHHGLLSSLVVIGENNVATAMAKTVGLPLGIAARLILKDKIALRGVHIPIAAAIYEPVLAELAREGIIFNETEVLKN